MLANVFTKAVRDRWLGTTIFTLALGLILLWAMSIYREIDLNVYAGMPDAVRAIMGIPVTADVGSMAISVFLSGVGAWVMAGLAIAASSAAIASEESNGTIGLLLGNPRSRTGVLASKTAAMVLIMALAMTFFWGAVYASANILDVKITGTHPGALALHVFATVMFFGFLALAIGAWTGNRGTASGTSTGLMVISIIAIGIFPLIDGWEFAAEIFPWYYLNGSEPLLNGTDWGHIGILSGCVAVFAAAAVLGVNRRDLKSRNIGVTLIDRLRNHPATSKIVSRLAGSARVSSIWLKTFSEQQGLLIVVCWIIFLTGLMMGPIYNFMPMDQLGSFAEQLPKAFMAMVGGGNFSTPEGYIQTEIYSLMAPAALLVIGIVAGAKAVAGEESNRTMGLLLASPVSRGRIIAEKSLAMVFCVFIAGFATYAGVAAGVLAGGLDIDYGNIAAISLQVTLLGLVYGGSALFLGAATGRYRIAVFGSIGFALISYITSSFLPLSESLAGFAQWSPYYYFLGGDPLMSGMNWGHAGILAGLAVIFVVLSLILFPRRDLVYSG